MYFENGKIDAVGTPEKVLRLPVVEQLLMKSTTVEIKSRSGDAMANRLLRPSIYHDAEVTQSSQNLSHLLKLYLVKCHFRNIFPYIAVTGLSQLCFLLCILCIVTVVGEKGWYQDALPTVFGTLIALVGCFAALAEVGIGPATAARAACSFHNELIAQITRFPIAFFDSKACGAFNLILVLHRQRNAKISVVLSDLADIYYCFQIKLCPATAWTYRL
jgi:hypothetical protein